MKGKTELKSGLSLEQKILVNSQTHKERRARYLKYIHFTRPLVYILNSEQKLSFFMYTILSWRLVPDSTMLFIMSLDVILRGKYEE